MKHLAKQFEFDGMRMQKREDLRKAGIEPYPYSFGEHQSVSALLEAVAAQEEAGKPLEELSFTLVGRIWSKRKMGKAAFYDLKDATAKTQLYLKRDDLPETDWNAMSFLDLGDIIGAEGFTFRTSTGELSLHVRRLHVLAKAVVNVPIGKETDDKTYYAPNDPELKYRERYLHWLLEPADRERIALRGRIISAVRRHMESLGFLEVQTPTIENVYGGAEARPFETEVWALGRHTAYLRISPELYLKRYIVAGFDKVFTICQNFRNEGIDHSHNPEFTMMEWYEAFTDYETQMERYENLVASIALEITGSMQVKYQGLELDFTPPWPRLSVLEALEKHAGLDAAKMPVEELAAELAKRGINAPQALSWGTAVATLFEEVCEGALDPTRPVFIKDHPIEISPLTKVSRHDPRLVERFEPYCAGMEIGNAYSELTDPVDQLERFANQRETLKAKLQKVRKVSGDVAAVRRVQGIAEVELANPSKETLENSPEFRAALKKLVDLSLAHEETPAFYEGFQATLEYVKNHAFENNPIDADFIKAIGCGMPPTGGVGLGIDRLVMLLTDSESIREIIPFPMVKQKG
jgi:lysyl-tRNA synthetase class 2